MSTGEKAHSKTSHRVVVALLNGKRERGYVYNFSPNTATFYLFPSESAEAKYATLVELAATKAIFFVKTHEGNKGQREAMRRNPEDPSKHRVRGHKMRITFSDGEEMFASTENYNPTRLGFFSYPLDSAGNNLRIFVVNANVRQVTTGNLLQPITAPPATQDRLARAGAGSAPPAATPEPSPDLPPLADTCTIPVNQRVEAVLRMVAGESAEEVSTETGIPVGVLSHWARLFLQSGKAGLAGGSPGKSDARDEVIKDLAARVCSLEDELDRVRGTPPGRK